MKLKILLIGFFLTVVGGLLAVSTKASHCPSTDYDCQITELQSEINAISPAHEKNKAELAGLKKQISDLTSRINKISFQLKSA